MNNTRFKLCNDKRLTIGYFGGSITAGAGASAPNETSWRALTTAWFTTSFPDCEIREINAAIGGTGSELGIFRMQQDLLDAKPDLVFLEFSINDNGEDYEETLANSEAIIRKLRAANPYADVICLHTTGPELLERIYALGQEYVSRAAHSAVMHRYGIPQIDVGEILRETVSKDANNWDKYMNGGPHPNDLGYRIYADAVITFLKAELSGEAGEMRRHPTPEPISLSDRTGARLMDTWNSETSDWNRVERSLCHRYPHYIEATRPGQELHLTFQGRRIGMYLMKAKDSGDLCYSIDNGPVQTIRTWDVFCPRFDRAFGMMLGGELSEGEHSLTLKVAETKAEESEGYVIRIGAWMVY